MMSKKAKNDPKHVEVLSKNIIQYLLDGFIKKEFNDDEMIKEKVIIKEADYKCDNCKKHFTTKQGRSNHNSKAHHNATGGVSKKYPCLVCGQIKSSIEILKVHTELKHKENKLKRTLSVMKVSKELLAFSHYNLVYLLIYVIAEDQFLN